jgi:DNA-binding transcriptional LysR family regulator
VRGASLRQLRAFAAVARHHSFVRAAAELHLTPSAISLQIKELEQAVGLSLFGRSGRAAALTRAGELLLVDVSRALLALKDAEDTLSRLRGAETGVVAVGIVSNANYFMPRLLARFHAAHPNVELRVSVGNREQLVRQLGSREIDLAIMGEPPADLGCRCDPLAPQPFGIVAAPEHPLAKQPRVPGTALTGLRFLVRESGSGTRAAMDLFFRDAEIVPARVMELTSNETIKQAVIANMGLAFLSFHTAAVELRSRQLVSVDVVGLPVMRRWHVVSLDADPISDAAESLRRFIVELGAGVIAQQFEGVLPERVAVLASPQSGPKAESDDLAATESTALADPVSAVGR